MEKRGKTEREGQQGFKQASWEEGEHSNVSWSQVQCFLYLRKEMWPQEWKEGYPERRGTGQCKAGLYLWISCQFNSVSCRIWATGTICRTLKIQCMTEWLEIVSNGPHSLERSQGVGNRRSTHIWGCTAWHLGSRLFFNVSPVLNPALHPKTS